MGGNFLSSFEMKNNQFKRKYIYKFLPDNGFPGSIGYKACGNDIFSKILQKIQITEVKQKKSQENKLLKFTSYV